MKYFVMGSVASSILLYGMSLIYGVTGSLEFQKIAASIALSWSQNQGMLTIGTVLVIVGLGFKLSQVPFHTWAPDVYEGAPHSITMLLSTAPKIAVMGLMILVFGGALVNMSYQWQQVMMAMAITSILIGNLFALLQTNFRRLLAYSAIAHMGYAVLGLITVNAAGFAAAIFYSIVYIVTTIGALGFLVLTKSEFDSYDNLDTLKGLNKTRPYMAAALTIILLSLAGIPPTSGFLSKFWILKTLMDSDHVFLTIAALVLAVIGAVYYIRIIKNMYFDNPQDHQSHLHKLEISATQKAVYVANIALILLLGIIPTALINYIVKIIPF
jgi:NADH-quinone oxidoreductase subunit N